MVEESKEAIARHPCYDETAHTKFARMHLPVAPRCNIKCNFCNRKYDCCNESRPGVTSEVLSPDGAAVKVAVVKEKIPELSVVAVAGPGDPLANEETFETMALMRERFPELTMCLSTNGLALPENAQKLYDLGLRFITVTMNATDPEIGKKIYDAVLWKGKKLDGKEGAECLYKNQIEGIKECVRLGMHVKINIIMIPGVNDEHIPEVVDTVRALGVHTVNILPLIPVEGTAFSNHRAPTSEEREKLISACSADIKMMRHCVQCRADAIGLLNEDRSREFMNIGTCKPGFCRTNDKAILNFDTSDEPIKIAVATSDGKNVDRGFGNTQRFDVYSLSDGLKFLKTLKVDLSKDIIYDDHGDHMRSITNLLDECSVIVVKKIGHVPYKILKEKGKTIRVFSGPINKDMLRTD